MKTLPHGAIVPLFSLFVSVSSFAIDPEAIVEAPGRWDMWEVMPVQDPVCYDPWSHHVSNWGGMLPILVYALPDTDCLGTHESGYAFSWYGELNEEITLPLQALSFGSLVDSSGNLWIIGVTAGEVWPSLDLAHPIQSQHPFQIWSNLLELEECDSPQGLFLLAFYENESADSMQIELIIDDMDVDSTFRKTYGPFNMPDIPPKVHYDAYQLYFPSFNHSGIVDEPIVVWWPDIARDTLNMLSLYPYGYESSFSKLGFQPIADNPYDEIADIAYPHRSINRINEDQWQFTSEYFPTDTTVSDKPPRLFVSQWQGVLAAWTSHTDTSGWTLHWTGKNDSILFIENRKEIDKVFIEGSDGYALYWTEYDSLLDKTTLYCLHDLWVGIDLRETALPHTFRISQVWPNPFNSTTRVTLALPRTTQIKAELFNLLGRRVRTIDKGVHQAGLHTITIDAKNLASGVYIIRVTDGNGIAVSRKIALVR